MKYWCFKDGFGLDNLVLCESEMPKPGPRDVLLKMGAASLNYRDLVVMRGQHGRKVQPPLIPLSDGVGRIVAIGEDVAGLSIGDRVAPAFYQYWQGGPAPHDLSRGLLGGVLDGVLASHRVFPASGVVKVPDHLTDAEVASLPCAGVTAWSGLSEPSVLRSGETALVQGSGGVALMALQLAKVAGARVIMTTSSAEKAARLKDMGADHVIDRSIDPDWRRVALGLTDGIGCDRVLELGGAATLNDSIKCVKTGGAIILIGNVTGNQVEISLPLLLTRRITLQSVTCGSRADLEALCRALDFHQIHPVIGHEFSFDEAPKAFEALEKGTFLGKVCVRCQEET